MEFITENILTLIVILLLVGVLYDLSAIGKKLMYIAELLSKK